MFEFRKGSFYVEDVSVDKLVNEFSSPLYIYSKATIENNIEAYKEAFRDHDGLICYAVKANSTLGILDVVAKSGAGFDIVSGGELERIIVSGGDPSKVVFSGVGKQAWEIEKALDANIFCFNVESESELKLIRSIGETRGLSNIPVSLRVNPDVDAKTHPYISTGLKEKKFGIKISEAEKIYQNYCNDPIITWKGIDFHIGSQLTDLAPFQDAFSIIIEMVDRLAETGIRLSHVDIGGGLGVAYNNESPPSIDDYLSLILPPLRDRNLKLIIEPGRSIIANAGILATRIIYLKSNGFKNFAIVDAAMNDLIRPSLYSAYHQIINIKQEEQDQNCNKIWDIVGPICETSDFLGTDRNISIQEGDILAILSAGAYGLSMSSQYNSRARAAEILVDGKKVHLIRTRETISDLYKGETIPSSTK